MPQMVSSVAYRQMAQTVNLHIRLQYYIKAQHYLEVKNK